MRPEDILATYSFNSLRTIARTRQFALTHLRRPDLISALAERLFDPLSVQRTIAHLSATERATLRTVVDDGGRLASTALAHTLIASGIADAHGPARPRETIDRIAPTTRRFDEVCARLTAHGLLFSEPCARGTLADPQDLSPGAVVFVPGPIARVLSQPDAASDRSSAEIGRLIVQPSFSVLLLPPLDTPTLHQLRSIADEQPSAEVATFKLTQAALLRAVEAGTDVAAVIAWLEERSGAPLPQNVRYTLDAWARSFDQVRVFRGAAVIEGTAEVVDQIVADPTHADLIVRRLGPQRVIVRDARAVQQIMAALNDVPHMIRYDRSSSQPAFTIDGTGTITRDPDTPNLSLPIMLRRIAVPLDNGRWQITVDRVRAAVGCAPDGVTGMLKWLRIYGGDIPAALITRLRMWTLPPDAIALEQPLLLHLPAALLDDLRAMPELAPLLNDEYSPQGAVVRIAPEQRQWVIEALDKFGITSLPQ